MKSKLLIVANWKMNPKDVTEAKLIFKETNSELKDLKNIKVVVCPPFVYLSDLEKVMHSLHLPAVILGAQDMFWEKAGPFTGEIGSGMLKGEAYVILGHSERRELGETSEMVAKKVVSAVKAGLVPILCVGEKERDVHGEYLRFLREQIIASLQKLPRKSLKNIIIAYEPVWAIGKDEAMKPEDIYEISIFIKKILAETFDKKIALEVPILYGGSVSHSNAREIVSRGEVQGLLIGRESLNPKKFGELLKNVN